MEGVFLGKNLALGRTIRRAKVFTIGPPQKNSWVDSFEEALFHGCILSRRGIRSPKEDGEAIGCCAGLLIPGNVVAGQDGIA